MGTPDKIWLSPPDMGGNEQVYVEQAFRQNWIAPVGPHITAFERSLETYLGNNVQVAALNSGTAAIHLGLILLGVERDDEVVCQSFTFAASVNPVVYLGAKPVFVDSETESWNMCPDALEDVLKKKSAAGRLPKAIIVVHMYGMPCRILEILSVAQKYGVPVLEDSAEALGSQYAGQSCGTFGKIGVLSFNGNKIITTSGGGALITNSEHLKSRAVYLATQSRKNTPWYEHDETGYNYRMSNISAAIGIGQMEVLKSHIQKRRNNHDWYSELFRKIPNVKVLQEYNDECFSNFWLTTITIAPSKNKGLIMNDVRLKLEEHNIESRPLWKPMHLQPLFKHAEYTGGAVAETIFNRGLCLPSGSGLTADEKTRIEYALKEIFS